jgi:hypothetical protein
VSTTSGPTTPYAFTWKGTAGTSGAITHYEAWYRMEGGALVVVHLATARATSLTLHARVGHRYRIAVRAGTASAQRATAQLSAHSSGVVVNTLAAGPAHAATRIRPAQLLRTE